VANRKITLNITPRTWVRATFNDRVFFRIPKDKLYKSGLARRNVLEAYNNWKIAVRGLANAQKFNLLEQGLEIKFFIPIPKTWKKYKQKEMNGKLHQQRPDLSNLLKSFEDAMISEDKFIAHYAGLSKVWVLEPEGRIEITIHPPTYSNSDTLL
jgi:Holliday junction resolvase RusA-like endonuclease